MVKLSASETTNLMTTYMTNTMASVVTADLLKKAEDPSLQKVLEFGLVIANQAVKGAVSFLGNDRQALPEPFTKDDILLPNSKYYSDNFVVLLKLKLAQNGMNLYGIGLSTAIDQNVRVFYKGMLNKTAELIDQFIDLMIKNGLHQPVIYLPRNKESEKIQEQTFFGKIFGMERSLSALEILQLTNNYQLTEVFHELIRSFMHTKNNALRKHFERGNDICTSQLETMQGELDAEKLPQLPTLESEIDRELPPPFSERLMLFKIALLAGATTGQYGVSASSVLRKDVGVSFIKMMGEMMLFAEDTGNLLVKYNMLDQPPLVKKKE